MVILFRGGVLMVFILGANQTTLTPSSSFFFFTLFVLLLSLHAFFFQCVFFGCVLEWSWAPLFMSALSVSAFAQILHRESDLLLFFKCCDGTNIFLLHVYIHAGKKSHQFRLHCFFIYILPMAAEYQRQCFNETL